MADLPQGYVLTSDPALIDPVAAHGYLTRSYWAAGIGLEAVEQSIRHSLCFAVLKAQDQIAFARVITDYTRFAYLADVYVLEPHQGKGIAQAMLAHIMAEPRLHTIKRWALFTKDAQSLYARLGWRQYPWPERMMVIDPSVAAP